MSKGLLALVATLSISVALGVTSASYAQTVEVLPQPVEYWQANPDAWPLDFVTVGKTSVSKQYAIDNILTPDPEGHAAVLLAQEVIAAQLNIAAGVDAPGSIEDTIYDAQDMLDDVSVTKLVNHDLGYYDDDQNAIMLEYEAELEEFNGAGASSLPVELASFDAQVDGARVTLRWTTASEDNNAGFEVEHRRGEDAAFETVQFVAGHGDATGINNYSANIADAGFGRHTFRLRQIDLDGSFSYSPEVEVNIELTERFALTDAYPNPFNPTTNIRFSLREAGDITLAVYDVAGRQVRTLASGSYSAGSHDVAFRADNLPSGTYLYRLQTEAGPVTGTLVLLK